MNKLIRNLPSIILEESEFFILQTHVWSTNQIYLEWNQLFHGTSLLMGKNFQFLFSYFFQNER